MITWAKPLTYICLNCYLHSALTNHLLNIFSYASYIQLYSVIFSHSLFIIMIITCHWFHSHLHQVLAVSGYSPELFSGHSIRIGTASSASRQGVPHHAVAYSFGHHRFTTVTFACHCQTFLMHMLSLQDSRWMELLGMRTSKHVQACVTQNSMPGVVFLS